MASRFQNGMQGVFLTAAELTHRGFVVSLTARNAFGAALLVTDNQCQHAWSVQVKTNQDTSANFWLLNAHSENLRSDSHVYVFVALKGNQRPKFLVVPSRIVAENVWKETAKSGSVWYSFSRDTEWDHKDEGWEESFSSALAIGGSSLDKCVEDRPRSGGAPLIAVMNTANLLDRNDGPSFLRLLREGAPSSP